MKKKIDVHQVAEVQLVYKSPISMSWRPQITGSEDAFKVFLSSWNLEKLDFVEEFKIMLLNRANRVLGVFNVSSGGIAGTVADPKVIFAAAIKSTASGIILCHNHPSGNLSPSLADVQLTKKLKSAGGVLDIGVLDHIILSSEGFYSFADTGLL